MLHFFSEFAQNPEIKKALPALLPTELMVAGVCAVDPLVEFSSRIFCFTGVSSKGSRKLFAETVARHGGEFVDYIRDDLDYLIIGDEGNPCWAFSCYGRKVERAVEMRRSGHRLLIIHERDFWDVLV